MHAAEIVPLTRPTSATSELGKQMVTLERLVSVANAAGHWHEADQLGDLREYVVQVRMGLLRDHWYRRAL
jgi:hypothetical protein